jgi:phenylalanyl-tRNA synthetase, beta subunit, non-spirochete bacterial
VRDLKAVLNRLINLPKVDHFQIQNNELPIPVKVDDADACPRFSGVSISGVTVKESPDWLKARLTSIGLTPINNIVDITNFICHELGQPLHAYDAQEIVNSKIWVKYLPGGTKFKTLDGKERELTDRDLMVCDGEGKPMCIAGVFGGENSGISEKTVNVFLEGAYWNPNVIRKTAMHHGLKTDASFRFERGTDPNNTVYAVKRAALLIQELAGGKISSELMDVYPNKIVNRIIEVKYKNVDRLIGKELPRERIFSILESLDIRIINKTEEHFTVSVPPYRVDVVQQADVVEEVLRIYGFNNIELSEIAGTDYLASFPENDINKFKKIIGDTLAGNGFYEILTNSLTNAAYQQKLKLTFNGEPVEIMNKLSEEQGILRQTMLFTGLEVCSYNINRKQKDLKLYEFGKIYWKNNSAEAKEVTQIYREEERLAIFISGNTETENWQNKTRSVSYFDLAQHVATILQKSSLENTKQEKLEDPLFDYGMRILKGNKEIGKLGKVKTAIAKELGIKQEIFYADLNTALLFRSANPKFVVQEVPKFPEVRRDLSLVLDKKVTFEDIRQLVLSTEKKLIKDIIAFDVYEGDKIPEGKKAYALGFTLLDEQKTLKDEEIDKTMSRLMEAFEGKMGAVIRK